MKIILVHKSEHLNQEVTGPQHWTDDIKDAQSDRTKVHALLVLSTLILFLKSSRLKSNVVVGGWQNRKTKVSKQSMMRSKYYKQGMI